MPVQEPARRTVASLAVALVACLGAAGALVPASVRAADPVDSPNLLDRPMADIALLDVAGPDAVPRLLVLSSPAPESAAVRATILIRDRAWSEAAALDVDLSGTGATETPWLIGLGPERFAVIAGALDGSATHVVELRTDGGPDRDRLEEVARTILPAAVEQAAAADVDGDGTVELVLGERPSASHDVCAGSSVSVLAADDLAMRMSAGSPGKRLAGGVIGQWDGVAGDDLLAYATPSCPAMFDGPVLLVMPLRPGATILEPTGDVARSTLDSPSAPLRLDVDGDGRHEALAMEGGLQAILDPERSWAVTYVDDEPTLPLIAATTGPEGAHETRLAWLGWNPLGGFDTLGSGTVRRGSDGQLAIEDETTLASDELGDRERWDTMLEGVTEAGRLQTPTAAWAGETSDPGCLDLFVPLASLPCGETAFRPAAAWVATRPLATIGEGAGRRLLVAGGVGWEPGDGLPATPTPWAAAPAGWWRNGPSAPFVISELRAADATYFRDFPVPRSTIARVVSPERTADLTGFTGTRLFVRSAGLADDVDEPSARPTRHEAFGGALAAGEALTVTRVPVPPGVQAGGDGGFARVTLAEAATPTAADPTATGPTLQRWTVTVVPISNWGELGTPHRSMVVRDIIGPSITMDAPFTSPVWPFRAELHGVAELGTTVTVGDLEVVEFDRRGRFTVEMPLAPWPQTIRLTATDPAGNQTVREVSVIGGLDYRRLPWPAIVAVALLALAAVSGVVGSRRARAAAQGAGFGSRTAFGATGGGGSVAIGGHGSRWRTSGFAIDDPPPPEIEELPPGAGLPRADATD